MPSPLAQRLARICHGRARPDSSAWLAEALASAADSARPDAEFEQSFAAAGRRLGTALVLLGEGDADLDPAVALAIGHRGLDEIGRVALILARANSIPAERLVPLVNALFYRGGEREKQAVLRALPLLPEPARFLEIAVEAPRASASTVFEAIACENVYPAEHFPELAFNQMVLKAIFNQVSVARIHGLAGRATAELDRMTRGYASERRAAGRPVPDDVALIAELAARLLATTKRSAT